MANRAFWIGLVVAAYAVTTLGVAARASMPHAYPAPPSASASALAPAALPCALAGLTDC